jgi:hypothetical protein
MANVRQAITVQQDQSLQLKCPALSEHLDQLAMVASLLTAQYALQEQCAT